MTFISFTVFIFNGNAVTEIFREGISMHRIVQTAAAPLVVTRCSFIVSARVF